MNKSLQSLSSGFSNGLVGLANSDASQRKLVPLKRLNFSTELISTRKAKTTQRWYEETMADFMEHKEWPSADQI
ncbi:hypothetical protein TNCV_1099511 [Trichonephila clavipes]|nr:hypothetical protein TNCV_1099511 [Trichonephila clavipes]